MIRSLLVFSSHVTSLVRGLLFSFMIGVGNVGKRLRVGSRVRIRRRTRLKVGDNVTIWDNVVFWGPGEIILGDHVSIGDNVVFYAREQIRVGQDSMIASFSFVTDADHGIEDLVPMRKQPFKAVPAHIGRDVWIGTGCTILKGAVIGEGSVIGANSVVTSEIPPRSVAVGTPARIVGTRPGGASVSEQKDES